MESQVQVQEDRVFIHGEMTVYTAAALKRELLAAIAHQHRTTLLDLSAVCEIDTAGLQLLLTARRLAATDGRVLLLADPSEAVRSALDLCGLSALLQNPSAELA